MLDAAQQVALIEFIHSLVIHPQRITYAVPFFTANWTEEEKLELSWDFDDLFIWAAYAGHELNVSQELYRWYDPTLGTCFTFNDVPIPAFQVGDAGEDAGFKALLRLRQDEYLPWIESSAITVYVHSRDEQVFIDTPHYFALPGSWSQFAVSLTEYQRLGGVYGSCVKEPSEVRTYYYGEKYTNDGCLTSCYQNVIHLLCGCTDPRYPGIENGSIPVCGLAEAACVLNVTDVHGDSSTWGAVCDCPIACEETLYDALAYTAPFAVNVCTMVGVRNCKKRS